MSERYEQFLSSKRMTVGSYGIEVAAEKVNPTLFPFQRDQVVWALRKGRAALFDDTGLGKTFMQLEWGRLLGGPGLIVAPLSVARQTVREGRKIEVDVHYTRSGNDLIHGINITNYEMIEDFEPHLFNWVALDESSILKSIDGKTKVKLIEMFAQTPYRLCCSATPAPNDIAEIANHASFLGHATREEMLATFFVHDNDGWRLKGWADDGPFYRWLSTWAMSVRKPSDLGYSDDGYILPPLNIQAVFVKSDVKPDDQLFFTALKGITDRASIRRQTTEDRIAKTVEIVGGSLTDQWLIWCGTNIEAEQITKALPGCVNVYGAMKSEDKAEAIERFQDGDIRFLASKPKIAGHGMNLQNCHNMVFLGLSDSYEAYYQCIRRCYRFGQTSPVNVYIVLSDVEQAIYQNVLRKEEEAKMMSEKLIEHVKSYEKEELQNLGARFDYETATVETDDYKLMLGDSCERMKEIPSDSVHLSVFSPPFAQLYVYSPTERDVGNCRTQDEFLNHFGYIVEELFRVTIPGRVCACHIADVPAMLVRDGYIGLKDLSGDVVRLFESKGWVWDARIPIDKNQQAQSIRTHSKALTMTQKDKDRSWLRPALPDYILKFRKPGENPIPVNNHMSGDEWIELANPTWPNEQDRCAEWGAWATWYGIWEGDVIDYRSARMDRDEKHICPLQLGTINRCVRLWTNPGETVLSPFGGIGSEGYESIKLGRKTILIELKPSYYKTMKEHIERAVTERDADTLFSVSE